TLAAVHQLLETRPRRPVIRQPPVATHEWIVLRAIHEQVHVSLSDEVDEVEPLLVGPGPTQEALDAAPDSGRRGRHQPGCPGRPSCALASSPPAKLPLV